MVRFADGALWRTRRAGTTRDSPLFRGDNECSETGRAFVVHSSPHCSSRRVVVSSRRVLTAPEATSHPLLLGGLESESLRLTTRARGLCRRPDGFERDHIRDYICCPCPSSSRPPVEPSFKQSLQRTRILIHSITSAKTPGWPGLEMEAARGDWSH